ncbi:hypothetical protein BGP_0207 [Beggiatoa sp. PS]|nr:hypothetical protein BGP_0207 [Beggiatoa sp. PS]
MLSSLTPNPQLILVVFGRAKLIPKTPHNHPPIPPWQGGEFPPYF